MVTAAAADNGCPDRPVRSISSSSMPADVCIPDGFKDVPVNYFDDFAWRSFVAMVWPARAGPAISGSAISGSATARPAASGLAAQGHRGVADGERPVGAAG